MFWHSVNLSIWAECQKSKKVKLFHLCTQKWTTACDLQRSHSQPTAQSPIKESTISCTRNNTLYVVQWRLPPCVLNSSQWILFCFTFETPENSTKGGGDSNLCNSLCAVAARIVKNWRKKYCWDRTESDYLGPFCGNVSLLHQSFSG